MTLCDKILLVDSLIKENPDVTIKDYLETVSEITGIKETSMWIIPSESFHSIPEIPAVKEREYKRHYKSKYVSPAKLHCR